MEQNKELTLIRTFDAPRETVWKYWTDPTLLQQWWGPNGVTNPTCVWEAKPNGNIHIVMLAGQELGPLAGQEWPMTGTVEEVIAPEKLVFSANAIMKGKAILEHRTTVTLDNVDGKTNMTVHIVVTMTTPEASGPLAGMEMGWNQQLDKLVAQVK
ncbi:MAG: SRPBCC domain-containing protein [Patescibacteria group bacterium]|nr:SRPBCC domain-containing protein [Patescibacteria group bacterium]